MDEVHEMMNWRWSMANGNPPPGQYDRIMIRCIQHGLTLRPVAPAGWLTFPGTTSPQAHSSRVRPGWFTRVAPNYFLALYAANHSRRSWSASLYVSSPGSS